MVIRRYNRIPNFLGAFDYHRRRPAQGDEDDKVL